METEQKVYTRQGLQSLDIEIRKAKEKYSNVLDSIVEAAQIEKKVLTRSHGCAPKTIIEDAIRLQMLSEKIVVLEEVRASFLFEP